MGIYLIYNSRKSENFNGEQVDAAKMLAGTSSEPGSSSTGYVPLNKILEVFKHLSSQFATNSDYVKKSELNAERETQCPSLSDYVLKSTVPPIQKCPSCVCPKIKVDANLCKEQEAPEPLVCPACEPCEKPTEKVCPSIDVEELKKLNCPKVKTHEEYLRDIFQEGGERLENLVDLVKDIYD
jgi:hypothetical protein